MLLSHGDSDRAVSPVIGVVLMVAVTVILASLVGGFVLNNSDVGSQPSASWKLMNPPGGNVTLQHNGGDAIDKTKVSVVVAGSEVAVSWPDDEITAGDKVTLASASEGDTVQIIYTNADGKTSILFEQEVP